MFFFLAYDNQKSINFNNGNGLHSPKRIDRSSPREHSRERITPDKLPEDLGLKEVSCISHLRYASNLLYITDGYRC